jgi:hypothetical protein
MADNEREDPQPDRGKGPPEGKGRPSEHGRPVPPHRSSSEVLHTSTTRN